MKEALYSVIVTLVLCSAPISSQTFTMGKKCKSSLKAAQNVLSSKNYKDALNAYSAFSENCKTKDAKEAAAVGKAEAFNGLAEYDNAILEADKALKITKNKSLNAHFQKAVALNKKGNIKESQAELKAVIDLTENNQNVKDRASNYALMAAVFDQQLKQSDSAMAYLKVAKTLDPENINYVLQEGDIYLENRNFESAMEAYSKAETMDSNSLEVFKAKSNAHLIQMSEKYGTSKAQELRKKMTASEKKTLCSDLNRALELGWKDMNKDMFAALVCK